MDKDKMENNSNSNSWKQEVSSALAVGWKAMRLSFLLLFAVQFALFFLEAPQDRLFRGLFELEPGEHTLNRDVLSAFYAFLIYSPIYASSHLVFLRGVRGEKLSLWMLFEGFSKYLNVLLTTLLCGGMIVISLVFFIIPGIYVACRLVFVAYLVLDEDMGPIEAIEASWRLTKGQVLKVIGLGLVNVPFALFIGLPLATFFNVGPDFNFLVVLFIPVAMWTKSALAALYLSVSQQRQADLKPEELSIRSVLTIVFSIVAMILLIVLIINIGPF